MLQATDMVEFLRQILSCLFNVLNCAMVCTSSVFSPELVHY